MFLRVLPHDEHAPGISAHGVGTFVLLIVCLLERRHNGEGMITILMIIIIIIRLAQPILGY
jgi:hypothetical protein